MSARDEVLARVRRAKGPHDPAPVPREYRAAGTRGPGDLELFAERLRDYRARVRVVDADEVARTVVAALRERGVRRVVAAPGTPPEWTELPYPESDATPDPRLDATPDLTPDAVPNPTPGSVTGLPPDTAESSLPSPHAAPDPTPDLTDLPNPASAPAPDLTPAPPPDPTNLPNPASAPAPDPAPAPPSDPAELSDPTGRIASRVPLGGDPCEAFETIRTAVGVAELERADAVVTACHVAVAETGTIVLDHDAADQGPRALTLVPDYHLVVVRADQVVAGVPDAVTKLAGVRTQTWISGPSATSDIELERVEGVHGPRTLEVVIVRRSTHSP